MQKQFLLVPVALLSLVSACDRGTNLPTSLRPGDASFGRGAVSDPTVTYYIANDASVLFKGDAIPAYVEGTTSPFAGMSRYADGECGVGSRFFALTGESGDATMNTAAAHAHCTAYPRTVRLTFELINADGTLTPEGTETVQSGMNLHQLEKAASNGDPTLYIPVGTMQLRGFHLGDDTGKCFETNGLGGLAFRPVLNDGVTYVGADDVQVYRNSSDTWTVSSIPNEVDPVTGQTIYHDKAYCRGNGKLYHMPLHFAIKSSAPLTP